MPWTALLCSENPLSLLPCSSLSPEYAYKLILTHTKDSFLPCCLCVFEILFDLSKILNSLLFMEFLHTCIPVNSIGLAIYFKNLCDCHSDPFDSTCVWMHTIISCSLEFILPIQTSFRTWAGSRPIKLPSILPLRLFNLSIPNQSIASDPLSWNS